MMNIHKHVTQRERGGGGARGRETERKSPLLHKKRGLRETQKGLILSNCITSFKFAKVLQHYFFQFHHLWVPCQKGLLAL